MLLRRFEPGQLSLYLTHGKDLSGVLHDPDKTHYPVRIDKDIGSLTEPLFPVQPAHIVFNYLGGIKSTQQRIVECQSFAKYALGSGVVRTDSQDHSVELFFLPGFLPGC